MYNQVSKYEHGGGVERGEGGRGLKRARGGGGRSKQVFLLMHRSNHEHNQHANNGLNNNTERKPIPIAEMLHASHFETRRQTLWESEAGRAPAAVTASFRGGIVSGNPLCIAHRERKSKNKTPFMPSVSAT